MVLQWSVGRCDKSVRKSIMTKLCCHMLTGAAATHWLGHWHRDGRNLSSRSVVSCRSSGKINVEHINRGPSSTKGKVLLITKRNSTSRTVTTFGKATECRVIGCERIIRTEIPSVKSPAPDMITANKRRTGNTVCHEHVNTCIELLQTYIDVESNFGFIGACRSVAALASNILRNKPEIRRTTQTWLQNHMEGVGWT